MITPFGASRRLTLLLIVAAMAAGCEPAGKADMELTQTLTQAAEAVASPAKQPRGRRAKPNGGSPSAGLFSGEEDSCG